VCGEWCVSWCVYGACCVCVSCMCVKSVVCEVFV